MTGPPKGGDSIINIDGSEVGVCAGPADEERVVARHTLQPVKGWDRVEEW